MDGPVRWAEGKSSQIKKKKTHSAHQILGLRRAECLHPEAKN